MFGIPIWVFVLFFVMLFIGIKRCYKRRVKSPKLVVLPIIVFILSVRHLREVSHPVMLFWVIGILIGILLGYLHVRKKQIAMISDRVIEIPGDWSMLILIMGIFFIEFTINYVKAVNPILSHTLIFSLSVIGLSGLITGMTLGRNGTYFYKFIQAKKKIHVR